MIQKSCSVLYFLIWFFSSNEIIKFHWFSLFSFKTFSSKRFKLLILHADAVQVIPSSIDAHPTNNEQQKNSIPSIDVIIPNLLIVWHFKITASAFFSSFSCEHNKRQIIIQTSVYENPKKKMYIQIQWINLLESIVNFKLHVHKTTSIFSNNKKLYADAWVFLHPRTMSMGLNQWMKKKKKKTKK